MLDSKKVLVPLSRKWQGSYEVKGELLEGVTRHFGVEGVSLILRLWQLLLALLTAEEETLRKSEHARKVNVF